MDRKKIKEEKERGRKIEKKKENQKRKSRQTKKNRQVQRKKMETVTDRPDAKEKKTEDK